MQLDIKERSVGDVTVLNLHGRLVLDDGDVALRQYVEDLVAHGRVKIVIDLTEVTHIDSAGLGTLAAKYVTAHQNGGDIRLCHLNDRNRHVLAITNLLKVFTVFDSEDDAIRSYAKEGVTT